MKKNVGKVDAYIRYGLGVVFVVLAVLYSWWFLLPAVVSVATGVAGRCGLYSLFGISTCKLEDQK